MPQTIRMYSTQWCADCRAAKRFLREHEIAFDEIDIEEDEQYALKVMRWSGGRRVIPTFEISCGDSTAGPVILHNPRVKQLAGALGIRP